MNVLVVNCQDFKISKQVIADEIDKSLNDMYRLLECRCVDARTLDIDGKEYDVWFDDEFLLNGRPFVPMLLLPGGDVLSGNIMFSKSDYEGGMESLTDEDAETIKEWYRENQKQAVLRMRSLCC